MPGISLKVNILRLLVGLFAMTYGYMGSARVQSSDRFGVIGVIAQKSSPQSKQSLAVIRDSQTSRNLVVRVGDKVPGGYVVKSIKAGEVRIAGDGQEFVLSPKSFDGVSSIASNESTKDPVEFDDSDIEEEFIEPPPPGSPPGTPGERYTMSPGEIRTTQPPMAGNGDYPTTRRPNMPPPAVLDGYGRSMGIGGEFADAPPPPPPPIVPQGEPANYDDSAFSGYEDLFEGP